MSAAALAAIIKPHVDLSNAISLATNGHGFSSVQVLDLDHEKNSLYEGYFLRVFTSFETTLESVFMHFACGGESLSGNKAACRLHNCTDDIVRRMLKQNAKWIDWANIEVVRDRVDLFFVDGRPFRDAMIGRAIDLAQIQKIRNRIAHDSLESRAAYDSIMTNLFSTKPIFDVSPGQLLRAKRRQRPTLSLHSHYMGSMVDVINAICEKP